MSEPIVTLARTAGFCFGVSRAVALCDRLLDEGRPIATLGPIIHNEQVVGRLAARGCVAVNDPAEAAGRTLVIRSHGVGEQVYDRCRTLGIPVEDATCLFVAKIHKAVSEHTGIDAAVFIAGDRDHPEVQGILGHCRCDSVVFGSLAEFQAMNLQEYQKKRVLMVAQTTFNLVQYKKCVEYAESAFQNIDCRNTVCGATRARQQEAERLAAQNDVMIVIGGRHSSNTKKLLTVCQAGCGRSALIEGAEDLRWDMLAGAGRIGVTAGASTPASIIEEVLNRMSEMIKENTAPVEGEINFEEEVENYLRRASRNQRYVGVVTSVLPNEVIVDIGTKQTGVVPADEMTNDSSVKLEDIVQKGDKLNLIVIKVNDQEGIVTLSKKRLDSEAGFNSVCEARESVTVVEGVVTERVNAGIVVNVNGVRVFVHESQTGLPKDADPEQLKGQTVRLKIIEAKNPRSVRGSIRRVLNEERAIKRNAFWAEVEEGKRYHGTVKSIVPYGAFVDLGGVDGMVHVSELSWGRIKNPADVLSVGDEIDVYVKAIDRDNHKVSLGYKDEKDNPWNALRDVAPGTIFEGPVVSMVKYGAFVRILPGLDGFVHISQISNQRIEKPQDVLSIGQIVKARLLGVDFDKQRISLSLRDENEKRERAPRKQRELTPEEIEARELQAAIDKVNKDTDEGISAFKAAFEKAEKAE